MTVTFAWITIAAGATFLYLFNPSNQSDQFFFPACPFRALTGFTCPGCGTTRGLHKLLHGDVIGAFQLNPLMLVLFPILFYVLIRYTSAAMGGHAINMNRINAKYIWILFAVVLSFWIFRNTPFYPFVS